MVHQRLYASTAVKNWSVPFTRVPFAFGQQRAFHSSPVRQQGSNNRSDGRRPPHRRPCGAATRPPFQHRKGTTLSGTGLFLYPHEPSSLSLSEGFGFEGFPPSSRRPCGAALTPAPATGRRWSMVPVSCFSPRTSYLPLVTRPVVSASNARQLFDELPRRGRTRGSWRVWVVSVLQVTVSAS